MKKNKYIVAFKIILKNKIAFIGLLFVILIIVVAIFAPLLAPFDPVVQNLSIRLTPPAWAKGGSIMHLLGTDDFGRDIFSRIIYGARISLMIGTISVGISLSIGLLLGVFAGYYEGFVDAFIMRIVDIMLAIPSIMLAIVIVAILGPSLYNAMIAIGIVGIPTYARLVKATFLSEKKKDYVIASKINGSRDLRMIFAVILPNCLSSVIVQSTMGFASAVLEAAGLSFLSLGAQPPTPEWGAMLAASIDYIVTAPWLILYPGSAIFITVMSFNLLGDGLMDILNPKI
jgi:peptide/nickel transport system permease protein/dipeptide transport system permease protein